jgi:hypothetical protein
MLGPAEDAGLESAPPLCPKPNAGCPSREENIDTYQK